MLELHAPDDDTERYSHTMSNRLNINGTPAATFGVNGTTADLRSQHIMMNLRRENDAGSTVENLHARASIAASAYRVEEIVAGHTYGVPMQHSWGVYTTIDSFASMIGSVYSGERSQANNAGARGYSTGDVKAHSMVIARMLDDNREVNATHVWTKIWWSVGVHAIASRMLEQNQNVRWAARPTDPLEAVNGMRGMNILENRIQDVAVGNTVIIEIEDDEHDLIPIIMFLLGSTVGCFNMSYGVSGGNARIPHILSMTPPVIRYAFLYFTQNVLPNPRPDQNEEICGLPAGPFNGQVDFETIEGDLMLRALYVLARSLPHPDGCESGFFKGTSRMFAEPFNGVTVACGSSATNSGYGYMCCHGSSIVPQGSLTCCVGTRMTRTNLVTTQTREMVTRIHNHAQTVEGTRSFILPVIFATQLACRQLGLAMDYIFSQTNPLRQGHDRGVLQVNTDNVRNTYITLNGDQPHALGIMIGKFVDVLYGSRLCDNFMCMSFGTNSTAATAPKQGNMQLGECLTSVHAAQMSSDIFTGAAVGLVGIPTGMDAQIQEFRFTGNQVRIDAVDDIGSRMLENGRMRYDASIGGLGHAVVMTRSNGWDGNDFRVVTSQITNANQRNTVDFAMAVPNDYAFTTTANFGVPGAAMRSALRSMSLFADYDIVSAMTLALGLPSTLRAANFVHAHNNRSQLIGRVDLNIVAAANNFVAPAFFLNLEDPNAVQVAGRRRRAAEAANVRNVRPRDGGD